MSRIIAGILAALAVFSLFSFRSLAFSDVTDEETFYYEPVSWAVATGITTGFDDGTFRPLNGCNRAAVVTFLWRLGGCPQPETTASFSDLPDNSDFINAISWAAEKGITTGYADGTFRPWNICNRAAIVTFLWRYAERPEPGGTAAFSDLPGEPDFANAISWAAEKGITTGYADGTFRPWETCNRIAAVSFLYRFRFQPGSEGPFCGCRAVCFGDSNARNYRAQYPDRGNIFMQMRSLLHITDFANYGDGGATFQANSVDSSMPVIIDQVVQAPAEGAESVDLVLLIGGINDLHYCPYDAAAFEDAVRTTAAAIAEKYPNALIIAAYDANQLLPNDLSIRYELAVRRVLAETANARGSGVYVSLADFCLLGKTDSESSLYESLNHYNAAGAQTAASRFVTVLNGGGYGPVAESMVTRSEYTAESPSDVMAYNYSAVTVTTVDPNSLVRTDTHEVFFANDFSAPMGVAAWSGVLATLPGTWKGEGMVVQGEVYETDPREDPYAEPIGTVAFGLANLNTDLVYATPRIQVMPAEDIPPGGTLADGNWVRLTFTTVIDGG